MKKAVLVARILEGLVFTFFGLNLILHFLHNEMPPGDAGQMSAIMATHGWMTFVGVIQLLGGVLLLVGRYVPLGLTLLAPVIVNILLFHMLLLGGAGIGAGVVVAVIELFLIWAYRLSFRGLFDAAPEVS